EFVERHFGRELLERVADPMLAGIYGGEAERLSARAALPRFVELERKHGSLIKAMQGARRTPQGSSAAIFTSLRSGMGELIEALVKKLDAKNLHLNQNIETLSRRGKKWICTRNGSQEFEAVIVALPAWVAAKLLASESSELAQALAKVRYTSSMTVALGFDGKAIERAKPLPPGFGFLVPRGEGRRLLACTLVHNKFPHRAPGGSHLVRLFFGGARDESALSLSDVEAISLARRELREITGFDAAPDLARVWRWPRAMAQYDVRHLELVKEIERPAQKLPGLALAGNAYHGVGIPDCIRGGRDAAQHLL
ncbi:MAG TPA: protoporphyrinogen oxidase, partial [Terriglobales bacterium]|nr:protoporphyrinogen oxidase [Terriglobales bacterium]